MTKYLIEYAHRAGIPSGSNNRGGVDAVHWKLTDGWFEFTSESGQIVKTVNADIVLAITVQQPEE